jgi:hypothetical protein
MSEVVKWVADVILTAFVAGYFVHGTGDAVVRAVSKKGASILGRIRELRIGLMAKHLRRLRRVEQNAAVALADMVMAVAVMVVGGGYMLFLMLVAGFSHLAHQPVQSALVSMLGGLGLLFAGFWRAGESFSDLTHNTSRTTRLLQRAKARGWDVEDAYAALR